MLSAAGVVLLILTISAQRFVFNDLAIREDSGYFPSAALGRTWQNRWGWGLEMMNLVAGLTDTVIGPKIWSLVMISITGGGVVWIVASATGRELEAGIAAVGIVLFPVATEPGVVVLPSHPFFAAPVAFLALNLLLLGFRRQRDVQWRFSCSP